MRSDRTPWSGMIRGAVLLWLVLVGALWCLPVGANDRTWQDPEAEECYTLIQGGKYIKARELATKMLEKDPDSFVACLLMGAVYARGEGSLPRAHYFLTKARARLESQYGTNPGNSGPWIWHSRVLFELILVCQDMDRYQEQIELLDFYEKLYRPSLKAHYGWPMMKLGQVDEARKLMALTKESNDWRSRTTSLNTLGAIEAQNDNPQGAYDTFSGLVDEIRRRGWPMEATFLYNAGEASTQLLQFEVAEKHLLDASRYFQPSSYTNPWELLSIIYAGQGRLPEAVSAVRKMHQWSRRSEPSLIQQYWASQQRVSAAVLLSCGYDDAAFDIVTRVLARPDRRGGVSQQAYQSESGLLIFYRELLRLQRERLAEAMCSATPKEWIQMWYKRVSHGREMAAARSRAAALIMDNHKLGWALRPYAPDGVGLAGSMPIWLLPCMTEVMGEGVAAAELKTLMERTDANGQREKPYLQLLMGASLLARGYADDAIVALTQANETLPRAELLLRARLSGYFVMAYQRKGDDETALRYFQEVMERDPSVIRQLGLALPVQIQSDGSAAADMAVGMLRSSPRFSDGETGFTLNVSSNGSGLAARLLGPNGTVFADASVAAGEDAKETARALCREIHRKGFLSRVDLSQSDINSLDGSNESGEAVRDQLLKMFSPGSIPTP